MTKDDRELCRCARCHCPHSQTVGVDACYLCSSGIHHRMRGR